MADIQLVVAGANIRDAICYGSSMYGTATLWQGAADTAGCLQHQRQQTTQAGAFEGQTI